MNKWHKVKVGQVWISTHGFKYRIAMVSDYNVVATSNGTGANHSYTWNLSSGLLALPSDWKLEFEEKVIPGTPLDPNLSILHAGYLQDRQRKRHGRQI
jgi:hypothetical protein